MMRVALLVALLGGTVVGTASAADDVEILETLSLPESHSLNWVKANTQPAGVKTWNWSLTDDQWRSRKS
ncbi:MAG: hypothetical protein QM775_01425 [Pirellulales bacterium]